MSFFFIYLLYIILLFLVTLYLKKWLHKPHRRLNICARKLLYIFVINWWLITKFIIFLLHTTIFKIKYLPFKLNESFFSVYFSNQIILMLKNCLQWTELLLNWILIGILVCHLVHFGLIKKYWKNAYIDKIKMFLRTYF